MANSSVRIIAVVSLLCSVWMSSVYADNIWEVDGKFGLGTTEPTHKLHVEGSSLLKGRVDIDGAYNSPQLLISNDGDNGLFIQSDGSETHYNWFIGQQSNVDKGLEFTPSTEKGGTEFDTPMMVLKQESGVGIFTKSPDSKYALTVGMPGLKVNAQSGSYGLYVYRHDETSFNRITFDSSRQFSNWGTFPIVFKQGNKERFRIDEAGRLGLGTASPKYQLDIKAATGSGMNIGGSNSRIYFNGHRAIEGSQDGAHLILGEGYAKTSILGELQFSDNITVPSTKGLQYYNDDNKYSKLVMYAQDGSMRFENRWSAGAADIVFKPDNNLIVESGRVGLGTAAPQSKLHVMGQTRINGGYKQAQLIVGHTEGNGIFLEGNGADTHYNWQISQQTVVGESLGFAPSSVVGGDTFENPILLLKQNGSIGIGTVFPHALLSLGQSDAGKEFALHENPDGSNFWGLGTIGGRLNAYTSDEVRLSIDSVGHVGIGTTSPKSLLSLGQSDAGKEFALHENSNGSNFWGLGTQSGRLKIYTADEPRLIIDGNGRVGIGTTSPVEEVHVKANDSTPIVKVEGEGEQNAIFNLKTAENEYYIMSDYSENIFKIRDIKAGQDRFVINKDGYVGMGTTSPKAPLHIKKSGVVNNETVYQQLIESYGDAAGLSIMHNSNGGILGYANLGEGDARNTFYISSGHADIGHHGLVMNNSGKVGLGLPMPEARLHLLDESERQLRLEKSGKNSGHIDIGADTKGLYIVGNRDNSLGDLPLLSIINNGSVGIGVDFWEMHKFSAYPGENTLFLRNAHGGLNSQMEILNKAHESRFRMRSLLDHSTLDDQWIFSTITDENAFVIQDDGNIGIGTRTLNDDYLLTINGGMIAKDVVVQSNIWADFVFEPGYELMPLEALDSFVKSNRHLPDIPSEADVLENGVSLKDMQVKLLQKVEELTLYTIQLNEQNKGLMQRVNLLEKRLNKLESQ